MLKTLQQQFLHALWQQFFLSSRQAQHIQAGLHTVGINNITLDHFAVIDLPSAETGMATLIEIFSLLDFNLRGQDYLANKQNDFSWLASRYNSNVPAIHALPQVVVADFRLDELPREIRNIISHYANQASSSPLSQLNMLMQHYHPEQPETMTPIITLLLHYFKGRDWPLPTLKEFQLVQEFNELLAWVFIFGRQPNHFTFSLHLQSYFPSLQVFNQFLEQDLKLILNKDGGLIKGGPASGIAQSSTMGELARIELADGVLELPTTFVEFVWRYPRVGIEQPVLWEDYFRDFIAQQANHVIESIGPFETTAARSPQDERRRFLF